MGLNRGIEIIHPGRDLYGRSDGVLVGGVSLIGRAITTIGLNSG
jgi:hypothetical protein